MKFDVAGKFDVLVIGSGISGLICALELAQKKLSVCILTKEAVTESSSQYAQGGIAVPLQDSDSCEKHVLDTVNAGAGLCNYDVVKELISNSVSSYKKLISYGVGFDLLGNGHPHQTREGAHSVARICHAGGDSTGRIVTKTLVDRACRDLNISISQGTVALSLVKNDSGSVVGILAEDLTKDRYVILAKHVIIATGGAGHIFENTTNPKVITGDGIVLSYRAGADLRDLEFIQFHPTVCNYQGEMFLITEAIRGEGGKLKNINGEYFAKSYHPLAELAPRDVLSRALVTEMNKTSSGFVYLTLDSFDKNYFKDRFPTIYNFCIERNIDLFVSGIPVLPAAHYFIGGVKCNVSGKTSLDGLWCVGEAASNCFHGANRLASNSLLECITVPHLLVREILGSNPCTALLKDSYDLDIDTQIFDENEVKKTISRIQRQNERFLGVSRNENNLRENLEFISGLFEKYNADRLSLDLFGQELKNTIYLTLLITKSALERRHSIGVHYRDDYKNCPDVFKHSISSLNKDLYWGNETSNKQLISFP